MIPIISVIIPVYNVEKYLRACLDSVMNQTFDNYEVIIVNDGSTDNSGQIAEEYKNKYSNINLIHQENKGLGGARNTAIEVAKGEYILFVDSDDTIHLDTLKLLYDNITKTNADLVFFGFQIVAEDGTIIKTEKGFEKEIPTLEQNPQLLMDWPIACNKLIRSELFLETNIRFPDRAWYEDLRTIPKLYLHAQTIGFIEQPLYFYLKRKGSITNAIKADRLVEIVDAVDDLLDYFKKQGAYDKYKDELEFIATYHAFYLGSVRVAQVDRKHHLLPDLKKYIEKKVPNYMQNKFLYRLGSKRLIVLKLLNKQHYWVISMLLKLKEL